MSNQEWGAYCPWPMVLGEDGPVVEMTVEDEPGPKWAAVAVYDCNKCYGGPEEGGWWYDVGTLCTEITPIICAPDKPSIEKAMDALEEQIKALNLNEGRREPSSMACDGYYEPCTFYEELPEHFPKERPRYE